MDLFIQIVTQIIIPEHIFSAPGNFLDVFLGILCKYLCVYLPPHPLYTYIFVCFCIDMYICVFLGMIGFLMGESVFGPPGISQKQPTTKGYRGHVQPTNARFTRVRDGGFR